MLGSMFVSTVKRLRVLKSSELSAFTRELESYLIYLKSWNVVSSSLVLF